VFVGHYGVSFAAKRADRSIPLWALFLAVQFLDILWAPFILLGIEKVRIVPGITKSNPLDLYYMPYTHGLPGALVWSLVGALLYQGLARPARKQSSVLVGLAVFSHWILDFIVHRPDLPLYDNSAKVGLGLWNYPRSRSVWRPRFCLAECRCACAERLARSGDDRVRARDARGFRRIFLAPRRREIVLRRGRRSERMPCSR
jgi:hypothetical protein